MIPNLRQFFTPWYLFARLTPPLSYRFLVAWLTLGVGLFIGGIVVSVVVTRRTSSPAWRRWWRILGSRAAAAGLLALLFLFFRYEGTPFFSMRLWMLLWAVGLVVAIVDLLWKLQAKLPAVLQEEARRARLARYLP